MAKVRVTKPGHADRHIQKRELPDYIAADWFPVWDQSLETLAHQVAALRDAMVDLASRLPQADRPGGPK